jgi:hypothetical protein
MTALDDDDDNHRVAHEVAEVVASALRQLSAHLEADASAMIMIQGGNVAASVNMPLGLLPAELDGWARKVALELRLLADDVEHGDTRTQLEHQAKKYRARQA